MSDRSRTELAQAVGLFSLIAISVNGVIGAGIFVLPAAVAKLLGPASLVAYLIAGLATVLIVLCFAEAGSAFERSGGPYIYARAAFGSFIGFEAGWMFLLARLTAFAAVSNGYAAYMGYFWPAMAAGAGRAIAITLAILALAAINLLGVRYGAWVVNLLTVGKLLPLLLFISVGLFFVDARSYTFSWLSEGDSLRQASLVLIFAFGGFEFASVPSEEVINPRRNVPIALVTAIALAVILYTLIQVVAMGTLPGLATDATPLASAGRLFLGTTGGVILTLGAILSSMGTMSAHMLVGPRMLHALAQGKQLPIALMRVHPRYRTPYISVILFGLVAWAFALYGSFGQLAALSAIARLPYYITTCLAVPVLRRRMQQSQRKFTLPGGPVIPTLGIAVSLWLLTGSSGSQAAIGGTTLLIGAVVYWSYRRFRASG